jgi:hypothetical protein
MIFRAPYRSHPSPNAQEDAYKPQKNNSLGGGFPGRLLRRLQLWMEAKILKPAEKVSRVAAWGVSMSRISYSCESVAKKFPCLPSRPILFQLTDPVPDGVASYAEVHGWAGAQSTSELAMFQ